MPDGQVSRRVGRGTAVGSAEPSTGASQKMQILNESATDERTDVAGPSLRTRSVAPSSTQYGDARRAIFGNGDGRRLSSEREAQIRQRVANGTYNSPSVIDELVRRIL